jgi:choline dehydrogenase-like flavoprotein
MAGTLLFGGAAMLSEVCGRDWDIAVIGAGLGGGTAGRRLVEMGFSVLFLEKGPFAEKEISDPATNRSALERQFWEPVIHGEINEQHYRFENTIGSGVGGSSLFYAATLERPERSDIEDSEERPHPTGGWPVAYDDFIPYFAKVERRFFVRGTDDPLGAHSSTLLPPTPLRQADTLMFDAFKHNGLHPYQVHVALRDAEGCLHCFGRTCPRSCKMDGRTAGVLPALAAGDCAVLDRCTVLALRGEPSRITHLDVERGGEHATIRAKRYILAAGGFGSPKLLLASASNYWPAGCGNSSGLVGRNLMFHLLESIAIWPGRRVAPSGPSKALTLRDLYYNDGKRYGVLQSSGLDAGYEEVLHAFRQKYAGSLVGPEGALRKIANLPVWLAVTYLGVAKVYRAIIEDLPYECNRVQYDPSDSSKISFKYTVHQELRDRRQDFRDMMTSRLKLPMMFLTGDIELDLSHTCGTLRFGSDANRSVLNSNCRMHDLVNLYVADASFMPTSCGVNPSLLTAANAMRVADAVGADLKVG